MTNDLCLRNETSIKTPKHRGSEKTPVGEHSEVPGGHTAPLPHAPPTRLLPRAVPES